MLDNHHKRLRNTTLKALERIGKDSGMEVYQNQNQTTRIWYTVILLCAVPEADKLPLKYTAKN